jgi:hypothetical protein
LATISGSSLQIWDTEAGRLQTTLPAEGGGLERVQYSPTGERVLAANLDGDILIWETQSGRLITHLSVTDGHFLSVSFSPDGSEVWAISSDGLARRFRVGATTHSGAEIDAQLRCRFPHVGPHDGAGPALPAGCTLTTTATQPAPSPVPYSDRLDAVYAGVWALRAGQRVTAQQQLRRARASLPRYGDALGLAWLLLAEGALDEDRRQQAARWAQIPALIFDHSRSPAEQIEHYGRLREFAERSLDRADAARFCLEQLQRLQPGDAEILLELQIRRVGTGQFAEALAAAEETDKLVTADITIRDPRRVVLWAFLWTAAVAQADEAAQDRWAGRLLTAYSALPDGALDVVGLPTYLRYFLQVDTSDQLGTTARRRVLDLWEIMKDKKSFVRAQDLRELLQNK